MCIIINIFLLEVIIRVEWFKTLDLYGHASIQLLLFSQRIENAWVFLFFVFFFLIYLFLMQLHQSCQSSKACINFRIKNPYSHCFLTQL